MTDPIADYLTRLRNAIKANHRVVEIPASNLKKEITKVLFDKGYILNYKFEETETTRERSRSPSSTIRKHASPPSPGWSASVLPD